MSKMRLENITFAYPNNPVLNDLSLHLRPGYFYGIVGPNGAGKSTLLKLLNRYLNPDFGTVFLAGRDLESYSLSDLAKQIALVPQTSHYFPFTVEEVVLLGRTPFYTRLGKPSPADVEVAKECMEITEISHLSQRLVGDLSGGERQRVTLARAFAQQTTILLLDEPTTHLDLEHQIKTCQLLKLQAEAQKTVVAVLHDLNLVTNYCDYVFVLNHGKLVKEGNPQDVFTSELIEQIYKVKVPTIQHPETGRPLIIP